MKNTLLAIVALIGLCGSVRAQVITNATPVWDAVKFNTTCSSTTIGTAASELTSNTTSPANTGGISQIKVANQTLGSSICCSNSSLVTCQTGASTDGDVIARMASATVQPNALSWLINVGEKWWCISTTALTGAVVCKVR